MKKYFIISFVFAFLFIPRVSGGMKDDTLSTYHIGEVTISHSRVRFFQENRKVTAADSLDLAHFSNDDLGALINHISPAYINVRGGNGSAAGITLRGTNSSQTTVNWNGFQLNSLTLGSADLSLVPVESIQSVSIIHGSSGTVSGSGSFGGSIELRNEPDWNNRLSVKATSAYGSFSTKRASVSARAGREKIQYHLNLFSINALNDFSYTDKMKPGSPEETISHNALENRGAIQNLFVRLPHDQEIEAGLWYQSKSKEIPSIMGSYTPGNAVQRDSIIRGFVSWTMMTGKSRINVRSSFMDEYMFYTETPSEEDSHNGLNSSIRGRKFMNDFSYRYYLNNSITIDAGASYNNMEADVEDYNGKVSEYQSAVYTGLRLSRSRIAATLTARKEFHPEISVPLLFSAGLRYDHPGMDYALKINYSDQFRIPTFNDKYWRPGGNPGLLPESGYTVDGGVELSGEPAENLELNGEISLFHSRIKNMIQWVPGSSYWSPRNNKEVHISGAEFSLNGSLGLSGYSLDLDASYSYSMPRINRTYDQESGLKGNMTEYVPAHSAVTRISLLKDSGHAGISVNYTGSRYTTRDNNPVYKLPPFTLFNLHFGYSITLQDIETTLQLRVMNVFDRSYQVVRAYPMPGRSIQGTLKLNFSR